MSASFMITLDSSLKIIPLLEYQIVKLISSLDSSTMATGLCVLGRGSSSSSLPNSRKPRADPFFLSIVTANITSVAGRASSVS